MSVGKVSKARDCTVCLEGLGSAGRFGVNVCHIFQEIRFFQGFT